MKQSAFVLRGVIFAAFSVFLTRSLAADGADPTFALRSLESERTIVDGGRYGRIESNGAGYTGSHFVPSAQRKDLAAGRYQLLGGINVLGTATTYLPPSPLSVPTLAIGQRFLRVTTNEAGEVNPTPDVVTLAVIESRRQPRRLTFTAPGKASSFIESDADVAHLPGVRPIESDQNLVLARRALSGRDAWTLGAVALSCVPSPRRTIVLRGGTRVRIEGVFRIQNLPSFHAIGQQNAWGRDSDSSFWTVDPLMIVVRVPPDAQVAGGSEVRLAPTPDPFGTIGGVLPPGTHVGNVGIVGPAGPLQRHPHSQGNDAQVSLIEGCGIGTNALSDLWELERTFTTVAPGSYRSWTSRVRDAIVDSRIILGLPRQAVPYIEGYPSAYGTVSEMNRLNVWSYDSPVPFSFSVGFGRDGRVTSYQPPGKLP